MGELITQMVRVPGGFKFLRAELPPGVTFEETAKSMASIETNVLLLPIVTGSPFDPAPPEFAATDAMALAFINAYYA